jgi:hypothetical protein
MTKQKQRQGQKQIPYGNDKQEKLGHKRIPCENYGQKDASGLVFVVPTLGVKYQQVVHSN